MSRGLVARIAAPTAFLLAATIAVLLVRSALEADSNSTTTEPTTVIGRTTVTETFETVTATQPPQPQPQYYVIESGDTLASVADDYGTTVERLRELNPGVDPVALSVGQRIRVG